MTDYTPNFRFPLPEFNKKPWQNDFYSMARVIDATLSRYIQLTNFQGVWANSTAYTAGQRVVDEDVGNVYECLVSHTSPAAPTTFTADRLANSSRWKVFTFAVQFRSTWVTATDYALGDIVVDNRRLAISTVSHRSDTFNTDLAAGRWTLLIDSANISGLPTIGGVGDANKIMRVDPTGAFYELIAASTARTILGLAIGTDVQAFDTQLAELAALTGTNKAVRFNGSGNLAAVGHRGAMAYRTADQTLTTSTFTAIAFGASSAEDYDTDGIHDPATNNSRFTVPAGITKVRLTGKISFAANSTGQRFVDIQKNGSSAYAGYASAEAGNAGATDATQMIVTTPVLVVVGGDYFELRGWQNSGGDLAAKGEAAGSSTWFAMEIVE